MARVVMIDVMGARWLLTNDVSTTRIGELDAAEVVVEVDDLREGSVRVHKNRDGSPLVVDSILKRAILRHWHGVEPGLIGLAMSRVDDVGPRYVSPDSLTLGAYERQVAELGATNAKLTSELATERQLAKTANDANHKLLAELGKFRDQETELRRATRAGCGETVLHALTRLEHTTTCAERETDRQRERAKRIEDERSVWENRHAEVSKELAATQAAMRGEDATAIGLQKGGGILRAVRAIESWAPAWVERVTKLCATLYRDDAARPKATIAYEYGAELPWRASMPGVLGVGHRSERARSPEGAAELLEEGLRRELQDRIDAARGELDTLAKSLEER